MSMPLTAPHDRLRVVFRYDDCSARSSLYFERTLIEAFARLDLQLTVGVVPAVCARDFLDASPQDPLPLPDEKVEMLRAAAARGTIEIALHGYRHQVWQTGLHSEFAGAPTDRQAEWLDQGLRILEEHFDVRPRTFVPPWNAYDARTVTLLAGRGFDCLSASVRGPFDVAPALKFLPYSCYPVGLWETARGAWFFGLYRPTLVVALHDFDFRESGDGGSWLTVPEFAAILERLSSWRGVGVYSLRQACEHGLAFAPRALSAYKFWRSRTCRLPWQIRRLVDDQVLWGRSAMPQFAVCTLQARVAARRLAHELAVGVRRKMRRSPDRVMDSLTREQI